MTQFAKSTRPLRPASYRAFVRRARRLCDMIDAHADAKHSFQRSILTRAIHDLSTAAQGLSRRHRGVSMAQEIADDYTPRREPMAMLPNDYHPGPRCSCRECLVAYPEHHVANDYDAEQAERITREDYDGDHTE